MKIEVLNSSVYADYAVALFNDNNATKVNPRGNRAPDSQVLLHSGSSSSTRFSHLYKISQTFFIIN